MWDKQPQHVIGATESGMPIHFHFSDGDADNKYTTREHHEAALWHDRHRNLAAVTASQYEKNGYKGAANGYRKLAAHHAKQSKMHMEKVLPPKR